MSVLRLAAVALLAAMPLVAGCSEDPKPAPAAPKATPVSDMDIAKYLTDHGVTQELLTAVDDFPLNVSVRLPSHWSASQGVPGLYLLLQNPKANSPEFHPNAFLRIAKLAGNFDPKQAILRGSAGLAQAKGFQKIRDSLDDFDNFPSDLIEYTYVQDEQQRKEFKAQLDEQLRQSGQTPDPQQPVGDLKLHVLNRYVIAVAGDDKFLVQLQVTVTDAQTPQLADDIKTIDEGLQLGFKK
ncbi:MAG: LpqN/LpqT family lipoprotein [Segniliparus sp.]|uniref:LpqN/LpqT family lipoprotein n=1 Tax=Segniliparus sp. TaxID=2804064 RepID=UPI003F37435B